MAGESETLIGRCLSVIGEGPSTTTEVSLEIGLDTKSVSSLLNKLMHRGMAKKKPFIEHEGGRTVMLWSLPSYGETESA